MFAQTVDKIQNVVSRLKGDSFTTAEIDGLTLELRNILLDADVPYEYIKSLCADLQTKIRNVRAKKLNKSAIIGGLLQSYIDATFDNADGDGIKIKNTGITTIGIFGPNGVGKTSIIPKIAHLIKQEHNKRIMCVSFDMTRFAAQEQLKIVCKTADIEYLNVIENGLEQGILKLKEIIDYEMVDVLFVDFAGISPDNQNGAKIWLNVLNEIKLDEKILVIDSTFGQHTIELIEGYAKIVNITGFAVSKVESDQKGGVFFSIATASNKPIYYVSMGEKINDIAKFNKRMVGDALFKDGGLKSVIDEFRKSNKEYIQQLIIQKNKHGINYNDLLQQLTQLLSFGKLDKVLSVLPHTKSFFNVKLSTDAYILIKKWIAIILSMTKNERANINILNIDRINRIARGSGTTISDVITLKKKIEEINQNTNG